MITTAEIDIRRRSLGLSIAETAEAIGASERVIRYWFSGESGPRDPAGVMTRLGEVEASMGDLVDSLSERAMERAAESGGRLAIVSVYPNADALLLSGQDRGLPYGAWMMAMSWLVDDLRSDGFTVELEWTSPE